jgi:hypothetical protein
LATTAIPSHGQVQLQKQRTWYYNPYQSSTNRSQFDHFFVFVVLIRWIIIKLFGIFDNSKSFCREWNPNAFITLIINYYKKYLNSSISIVATT